MTRRQQQIPGTERKEVAEVETAAEAYREVVLARTELSRKEKNKKLELLAIMRVHKVSKYKYDDENGEEILVSIDEQEPKVSVKKTGEAESAVGEGLSDEPTPIVRETSNDGVLAQAARMQRAAGVEENDEGDVVPPDEAAPKKKRGGKKNK